MSDLRSATNWSSVLDSSHALRKLLKQRNNAARKSIPTEKHDEWPLNSDWKLARDPTHRTEASAKKSNVCLPKKVERMIWAKPSMVELTKAAVRTERAKASAIKFHEKLQAKKAQPEKTDQSEKPQKTQRPPLWRPKILPQPVEKSPSPVVPRRRRRIQKATKKAAKASAKNVSITSKSAVVSAKKTPSPVSKTRKPKAAVRWIKRRPSNILVVDANANSRFSRPNSGGAELPMDSIGGQAPRRSKKSYGVPLCNRPTKILGMGYPYSRRMQMRQQQLCEQPEYRDQYVRMLHRQQRQMEQYYGQPGVGSVVPDNNQQQILHMGQHQSKYAVPAESPLQGLKKGKRLCGNFYFD